MIGGCPWWLPALAAALVAACATAPKPTPASQARWRGDFDVDGFRPWSYLLNPRGLSVVREPIAEGLGAARVVIRPDDLWPNGLNRVELEHKPAPGTVAEGRETYFAWRFMVPVPLSPSRHQIGYWESYPSYRQIMSFEARGTELTFVTRLPAERVQWSAPGAVTPEVWHRIVMHVLWSVDPAKGLVEVWFDGKKVVDHGHARTLWDAPNFVHVGLLRDVPEPPETMYVDSAVEAGTFEGVLSAAPIVRAAWVAPVAAPPIPR